MLKYLYANNNKSALLTKVAEQKLINTTYTNKFYIRSSIIETKDILILDNSYNFFLLNKKNIAKHLSLLKEKNLLGKALQIKEFIYSKKKVIKFNFFIGHKKYYNSIAYLKLLFILKKHVKASLDTCRPLLIINRGKFVFFINGLKGSFPKKKINQLKKLLKKLKQKLNNPQKFLKLLFSSKKLILRSLLFKSLKTNKTINIKNKYKNQIVKPSIFPKNKYFFNKLKKII